MAEIGQLSAGVKVKKVTGDYNIVGVVRSVFTTGNMAIRVVVEHTVADEHGSGSFLHIYSPANLEVISQ